MKLFSVLLLFLSFTDHLYSQGVLFSERLHSFPNEKIVSCVPNTSEHRQLLDEEDITIKYYTENYLFISATPKWLDDNRKSGSLSHFYFEYAPPSLLSDSARVIHRVDSVHNGLGNLSRAYTGKNVLLGLVDTGLDYRHPDFLDSNGRTRVLRYWDHNLSGSGAPMPYNYGVEFDSTDLNSGLIPSNINGSAHGSTVTGMAVGNGRANGTNIGMAPDANIVVVHTNFNLNNWTLTVADAVDYIFKIADDYGMPAVVNLSVGSYLGSHDGNDPASEAIEALLEAKRGRIVVCAAGNSGAWGKYHLRGNATPDTSFTWFLNNPNSALGANKIYFDFWTDEANASTMKFSYGADNPSGYKFRGESEAHFLNFNPSAVPLIDTIYGPAGHILAVIETYREQVGGSYHLECFFSRIDSTSYYYRFSTSGSGTYDLWSGTSLGLNTIVESIPTTSQMPKIADYQLPDANQTIVSSWNCSEKVISVGNIRNRWGHVDKNNNNYTPSNYPSAVGQLSPNSSKGPSRHSVTKPDIVAGGDVTLGAGPLAFLSNPANNGSIESGGWHMRNGGTSMASPVVAGIAALYLEKCPKGNFSSFKNLLINNGLANNFTGTLPNNAYGYGLVNGMGIIESALELTKPVITQNGMVLSSSPAPNYQWLKNSSILNGETSQSLVISPPNTLYEVEVMSNDGCVNFSDPFQSSLSLEEITLNNKLLVPNPSTKLMLWKGDSDILSHECFDVLGNKVNLVRTGNLFQTESLAPGAYFLSIETENKKQTIKFVRNN